MPAQLRKQYTYSDNYSTVRAYPNKRAEHVQMPVRKKRKKQNPILLLIRFVLLSSFLTFFAYFVSPYVYEKYFEPLFLNHFLNRNIKIDTSSYVSPTLNYLSNSELFGRKLLVPFATTSKNITKIQSQGELSQIKADLNALFQKYPNLKPSVYIWEYTSAKEVDINADSLYSSASIIKLPVLFELFRKIDRSEKDGSNDTVLSKKLYYSDIYKTWGSGKLQYGPVNRYLSVDYLAKIMITQSDNSATNMLIEEVGGLGALNSSMRSLGLDKIQLNNWLPDVEGKNKISARQIATLLYNLDNPRFLSQKSKITIKEYMANVENRSLLQAGLPPEAILIHKTGDIGKMLGDAGVVYAQNGKKYIIVVLVNRPHNDYSARNLIQEASELVYKRMLQM